MSARQELLDIWHAGPYSPLARLIERIENEAMGRIRRTPTLGSEPCPGYGHSCGVLTPRPLCYFCTRSKDLSTSLSKSWIKG